MFDLFFQYISPDYPWNFVTSHIKFIIHYISGIRNIHHFMSDMVTIHSVRSNASGIYINGIFNFYSRLFVRCKNVSKVTDNNLLSEIAFQYFFFQGMDAVAPGRETAMADALAASSSPSCTGIPSMIEEIKYPVKVSPAAVVSTAFTLKIP